MKFIRFDPQDGGANIGGTTFRLPDGADLNEVITNVANAMFRPNATATVGIQIDNDPPTYGTVAMNPSLVKLVVVGETADDPADQPVLDVDY